MVNLNKVIGKDYYEGLKELSEKGASVNQDNFFYKSLAWDEGNSGEEFVPTILASRVIRQVYERSWHRQLFNTFPMSSVKEEIPKFTRKWTAKRMSSSISSTDPADQLDVTSTSDSTGVRELHLSTLTVNLMIENKFLVYNTNDQIDTLIEEDLVSGIEETELDAIINGDSSDTHQDEDVEDSDDPRKAFDGLRKLSSVEYDVDNNSFSFSDFNNMLKEMGRYARGNYEDLVLFVSPSVARDIRLWNELTTIDKYGPNATVVNGEIGKVSQVSVVEIDGSIMREDLDTDGTYDSAGETDRTIAILTNRSYCWLGVPRYASRTLGVRRWDDPRFDRMQLIGKVDLAFNVSFDEAVVVATNISTS